MPILGKRRKNGTYYYCSHSAKRSVFPQAPTASRELKRMHVRSSAIRSIGYNAELHLLEIEYVSGDVYLYNYVPERGTSSSPKPNP